MNHEELAIDARAAAAHMKVAGGNARARSVGRLTGTMPRPGLRIASGGATVPSGLRREAANRSSADEVLPERFFLGQLQREKRRTDRSKAPLSLLAFHFDPDDAAYAREMSELIAVLCRIKRETDVVGYLGGDTVAALLPDTDEGGAGVLLGKVLEQLPGHGFSPVAATYPDQLFDHIAAGGATPRGGAELLVADMQEAPVTATYRLKRAIDVAGALAAIVALSPVMIAVAAAVRMSSPGPIIFKQNRLGRRGAPFAFYKFRSMYCNTDDRIHREFVAGLIGGNLHEANHGDAAKPMYKMKNDPRITRVGRFIRRTSIDELPQLFNVLKGDMSLVGPRPPLPYEAEKYDSWHLRRILEIKPGITGVWQVEGRSRTSFDDMVRMDLQYVRRCSLAFDLKLLLKTVKVVLRCEGAA
jgi:lipopolysaccharide/colanic/teichoic acid biosynthesis glycosyltransferase